jgi:hypothetical protein
VRLPRRADKSAVLVVPNVKVRIDAEYFPDLLSLRLLSRESYTLTFVLLRFRSRKEQFGVPLDLLFKFFFFLIVCLKLLDLRLCWSENVSNSEEKNMISTKVYISIHGVYFIFRAFAKLC